MGIRDFFQALFGRRGRAPGNVAMAYVKHQQKHARGKLAASRRCVTVITNGHAIALHLSLKLKPVVEEGGFAYEDRPNTSSAVGSQILILDCRPRADALMHGKYDQIIRVKKSMGKVHDALCMFGPRENYKKYPRGTYPGLSYFCIEEDDLNAREPDLPETGVETIEGATLYNFADLPGVIAARMEDLSSCGIKLAD